MINLLLFSCVIANFQGFIVNDINKSFSDETYNLLKKLSLIMI